MRLFALIILCAMHSAAYSENLISVYGGLQSAAHSKVVGKDHNGDRFNFVAGWDGNSFEEPAYYGVKYTHWYPSDLGFSVDFAHAKVYADDATFEKSGFETLEFTDGLNILTLNILRRYSKGQRRLKPYWGTGIGITIPHVEVQTSASAPKTFEFQFGGYAFGLQGGFEYLIAKHWTAFAEYKFNYTVNTVDLKGGGELSTNIITNAFNLGIGYRF